jgi:membrane fusion protein (multidrug efflux system)
MVRRIEREVSVRQRAFAVILVAAAFGLAGCARSDTPAAAAAPATPATAQPAATAPDYYEASGPLVVENQVDIAAQRDGVVAEILVDVGGHVRKGQLLARLDDRQLLADRDAANADYHASAANLQNWQAEAKVLESDFERDQQLWNAQLITKQQLEHSQYKVSAAKYQTERDQQNLVFFRSKLRSIELELDKTRIVAPFDGVVARRYIRAGQKVAVNDRLFWVSSMAPLNVRFTVPQEFAGKLRAGDEVLVAAPASPGERHAARVTLVSPVVDPSSGTLEVQARVSGAAAGLLPGMTVSIRVPKRP